MSRTKKVIPKTAGEGKRIIAVFGPPASGVTTILEVVKAASETPIAIVPYVGPTSMRLAEEALQHHEVVFLDVDGGVFGPSDVQALVDEGLLFTGGGAVIRVSAAAEDVMHRAASRPDYITEDDVGAWTWAVLATEDRIRLHALNYFMVPNGDLSEACRLVALRAGLTK